MEFANLYLFALISIIYVNDLPANCEPAGLYTRRELGAIKKFQPMVSKFLTQDFMKRDGYLLRFLRSYDFDFEKAARRLEYSVNYRKEKKIDGILDEDLRAHAKQFPLKLSGLDKHGYPVAYVSWEFDVRKYVLGGKQDILLRYLQQVIERIFQQIWKVADETGKDIDQYYMLGDLAGFNARKSLCFGCIPVLLDIVAAFDGVGPVFAKNVTIVNTPRAFTPLLNLFKSTFPFPPVSLLTPYDNNANVWKKELLKDISPDQLLKKYGGTREG